MATSFPMPPVLKKVCVMAPVFFQWILLLPGMNRYHSGYGLIQWKKVLHSNASFHWLHPYLEWCLMTLWWSFTMLSGLQGFRDTDKPLHQSVKLICNHLISHKTQGSSRGHKAYTQCQTFIILSGQNEIQQDSKPQLIASDHCGNIGPLVVQRFVFSLRGVCVCVCVVFKVITNLRYVLLPMHSGQDFCVSLQWLHNEHDGVPYDQCFVSCSTVCWGIDQRKHQSSASLAFVRGIHRWLVDSPHKGPVTQRIFPSCHPQNIS